MSSERKKVGLALGSGFARGFMHVGVIRALRDAGIPIDFIAGTSAGAVVGGMYCYYGDIERVEKDMMGFDWKKVPLHFLFNKGIDVFFDECLDHATFDDLKIPFRAVAFDIEETEPFAIKEGRLGEAIDASASLPYLFRKKEVFGKTLIDGGLTQPVPVKETRDMGADVVISVNLKDLMKKKKRTGLGGAPFYYEALLRSLSSEQGRLSDVSIKPRTNERFRVLRPGEYKKDIKKLIKEGERFGREKIGEIKSLLSREDV